jgi:RNA polymerase sigma-70 factor (ECF subfamily)
LRSEPEDDGEDCCMDPHDEFLPLFLRHQGELRAFIGSVVRDRSVRDDVLQETALVLWREFERYDRARSFGGWARGIASRLLLKRLEQLGRQPFLLPPEAIAEVQNAFDRLGDEADARREGLERCLEDLPEKSRGLLALRYEQGLSLSQIAERIETSMDAAHKTLSRIRAKLQECVERRLRSAEGT